MEKWLKKYKDEGYVLDYTDDTKYPQVGPKDWMNQHGWLAQYGGYSTEGYKSNSQDNENPFNIINSGNITMDQVEHPVHGIDDKGNQMTMLPGKDYKFPGNKVLEIPLKQKGGWIKKYS